MNREDSLIYSSHLAPTPRPTTESHSYTSLMLAVSIMERIAATSNYFDDGINVSDECVLGIRDILMGALFGKSYEKDAQRVHHILRKRSGSAALPSVKAIICVLSALFTVSTAQGKPVWCENAQLAAASKRLRK